jgi:hypothetical protein
MADVLSTRLSTPDRDTECTLVELFESHEIADAYLKEKGAPGRVSRAGRDGRPSSTRCNDTTNAFS